MNCLQPPVELLAHVLQPQTVYLARLGHNINLVFPPVGLTRPAKASLQTLLSNFVIHSQLFQLCQTILPLLLVLNCQVLWCCTQNKQSLDGKELKLNSTG